MMDFLLQIEGEKNKKPKFAKACPAFSESTKMSRVGWEQKASRSLRKGAVVSAERLGEATLETGGGAATSAPVD